jgi:hypothetical protein
VLPLDAGDYKRDFDTVEYAAIALPAAIDALGTLTAQRDYRQHERRYRRKIRTLTWCASQMREADDLKRVQDLVVERELVMRQEAGEWLGVVRLRDLEPV